MQIEHMLQQILTTAVTIAIRLEPSVDCVYDDEHVRMNINSVLPCSLHGRPVPRQKLPFPFR